MPTVTVNAQQINYFHNGRTSPQPAIVLVHGAGGCSQSWPYQWLQTDGTRASNHCQGVSDYPVYIPDLPGHGQSDPPGYDSITAYAQFIIDFTVALGLENVVVAGHSMGGAIAQMVGIMRPANLRGLVVLGSGAKMDVNEIILNGLRSDFEQTVRLIAKFSWPKTAAAELVETGIAHMLATEPQVVYEDFVACNNFDERDRMGGISVPVLIIGGQHDKMMRMAASEEMAALIESAELVAIDAGHFMMYEKTAQTTGALVKFLATIEDQCRPE